MSGSTEHGDYSHIPGIKDMMEEEGLNAPPEQEVGPSYKKMQGSRIPVSKQLGKLWQGRVSAGKAARDPWEQAWDEAVQAYNADQQTHRTPRRGTSSNKRTARKKNEEHGHTENVIFSAIKALLPAIYARNPTAEFTAPEDSGEARKLWVSALEKVCNTIGSMRHSPGVNLKYKVKQAIVATKLMNLAWVETGYTIKTSSSDQAMQELESLSQQYAAATDSKDIVAIEGKLMALEEQVNVLAPSGPYVRFYSGKDVIVDPEAMEPDFSDAKWMAVPDYIPTSYLNAVYGKEPEQGTGVVKSVYEPTAVLTANTSRAGESSAADFKLFDTNAASHYGYDNQDSFKAAQRTKCWRIYDKVTRRVLLYADNKWDWPVWVEDDQLQLPTFYPFEPLIFNVSPQGPYAFSEVAYVLDQQDAINEINDAERRARFDLQYRMLFDSSTGLTRDGVVSVLKGAGPVAEGVKVPEGKKIDEMFYTPQPNILKAPQLFDVQRQRQVVDGILGVTPSLRASEFKTNTTNKAIEQYNSTTSSRLDEQIDEIEEFIGRIYYNLSFLCARFMTREEVSALVGEKLAEAWQQVDNPQQLASMFTMRVVGGSTTKPTSQFKQQVAVQLGQVLGQFANAAPGTITRIVLSLFENAYDEVGITQQDWDDLKQEVNAKLQIQATAAQPTPPPADRQSAPGANAGVPSGGAPSPGGDGPNLAQVAEMIDTLPPEAKIALGNAMAKGVPIVQALQQMMQLVQQPSSPQQ